MKALNPQIISDDTIRGFLLAQLSPRQQSAFEAALFSNSQLEQRVRLAELELIDDYAADCLSANERAAFQQKFLVTVGRQKALEVSSALRNTFAPDFARAAVRSFGRGFAWPRLAWRVVFALIALAVLLASALVIRREPQLVERFIPRRFQRPVAVATPTSLAAHHSTNSSEPTHRDDPPALPEHEASPQMFVLRPGLSADGAPVVSLTQNGSNLVRLELMLKRIETANFSVVVTNSSGEVVHNIPEMRVEHAERVDFDVASERLKPGDFLVTLTRINDEHAMAATYYFRVP